MKILYIGSVTTPDLAEKLSGTSVAGNKMQYNVIKELEKYEDIHIDVITDNARASFPKDRTVYERRKTGSLTNITEAIFVGYCNLPILKQVWHTLSIYHEMKKYIHKHGKPDIVFCFNLFPQTGFSVKRAKLIYDLPVVSLLADLPIDDSNKRSQFMKMWRKLFDKLTIGYIKECDNIIALNKNAIIRYHPEARYQIVDGGIDLPVNYQCPSITKPNCKNIVFAGSLVRYNGILQLLEAMSKIHDKDIVLDIYGDGDLRETVRKASESSSNIVFHGRVTSDELTRIYSEAWMLINPRPVNDRISQVTFPSKMFEYLVSGTPVLATHLSGFTEEYNEIMYFAENDTPEALADAIDRISMLTDAELLDTACKAQKYVLENKTWKQQCKKIKIFLTELIEQ